ncbi:hypothetical protein M9458_005541, partial [Cirrhinus mrigala]
RLCPSKLQPAHNSASSGNSQDATSNKLLANQQPWGTPFRNDDNKRESPKQARQVKPPDSS